MTKSLLISGTHSGCGKTSLTLGLLAAFTRRGLACAPFKTGPDFIDPGLHTLACGRTSHNLDSWMLSEAANRDIFARYALGADVAVAEGAMGLFDGASGLNERGSAAHMAKMLGIPVLLVIDASGMARSAAAVAQGFACFDPKLSLAGVVFNRVGGPGHREILSEAMAQAGIRVLGYLPKSPELALPSRYLGLVTAEDLDPARSQPAWLARLADWVEAGMSLDALLDVLPAGRDSGARATPCCAALQTERSPMQAGEASDGAGLIGPEQSNGQDQSGNTGNTGSTGSTGAVRLGVARDKAFCFAYAENLRLLEAAGAEIVPFSPLADAGLPENLHGLYLPGGYPELHAQALSQNGSMLADIRGFALSGRPVYAECGGFMALMQAIVDAEGRSWPMAAVFPCTARMQARFSALGYREARLTADTLLGPQGTAARGHEFHYSRLETAPDVPAIYSLAGRKGPLDAPEGFLAGNTLGSYVHLHFASNPALAANFVDAMRRAEGA